MIDNTCPKPENFSDVNNEPWTKNNKEYLIYIYLASYADSTVGDYKAGCRNRSYIDISCTDMYRL